MDGIAGLAAGCRAQDADKVDLSGKVFVKDFPDIDFFRRRQFCHRGYRCERSFSHNAANIIFKSEQALEDNDLCCKRMIFIKKH